MRRQNTSCDQCRKAKRACDATVFGGQEQRAARPCSYCHKTKKHCTRYWADSSSACKGGQSSRRRGVVPRTVGQSSTADSSAAGLFNVTQVSDGHLQDLFRWNPGSFSLGDSVSDTARDGFAPGDSPLQQTETSSVNHDALLDAYTENNLEDTRTTTSHWTASDSSQACQDADCLDITSFCRLEEGPQAVFQTRSSSQSSSDWSQISGVLSPFSPQHIMTSRTHNRFISQNLMHVYHDVFEHSLSCWVSEESCPYKVLKQNRNDSLSTISIGSNPNLFFGNTPGQQEWGDIWSNRIYARVIKLDRAVQMTGIIQLTRSEDQAASKALNLSIMAFAAQWAYKSRREQRQYSSSASESQDFNLDDEMIEEFDRQIQRSLWWQARKALNDCAELECYRVVCAELIFGLTQKPWDSVGFTSRHDDDFLSNNQQGRPTANTPITIQVQNILSRDGPPIFIERAARKAYTLKYMMDAKVAGLSQPNRSRPGQSVLEQPMAISAQDRQAVGFLYWLAVMFDTISASMNQRPVVVADRDCQHDATDNTLAERDNGGRSMIPYSEQRWAIHLFIQDDPMSPTQPLRWPCSYDAAARAVTRSGPVKILLYRHVIYLQDAIKRRYRGELIEEIIRNAVLVYRYWNTTYGVFFRDLIQNYGTVPPRIRSWFFCILAHWHLAALILADLLEWVDEAGLGDYRASQVRVTSGTSENIRRASADELADLARVVTPPDWAQGMATPPPQLPGFHSSVNQGTILTEPWTEILVRAFSKAFIWHFEKAQLDNQHGDDLSYVGQDIQRKIAQCTDCVKALWHLGKKSDVAWAVAETLASALAGLEK